MGLRCKVLKNQMSVEKSSKKTNFRSSCFDNSEKGFNEGNALLITILINAVKMPLPLKDKIGGNKAETKKWFNKNTKWL